MKNDVDVDDDGDVEEHHQNMTIYLASNSTISIPRANKIEERSSFQNQEFRD